MLLNRDDNLSVIVTGNKDSRFELYNLVCTKNRKNSSGQKFDADAKNGRT
jgi:hypothetical protein